MPRPGFEPTVSIDICESAAFYQLCHKSNLRFAHSNGIQLIVPQSAKLRYAHSNWIQLIVPQSAKCFYSTMVKHCNLTGA
jgi:hypothetical protein